MGIPTLGNQLSLISLMIYFSLTPMGNTDNTTSPVVRIADQVTVEGRMTKRKLAWDVFLDVAELEKRQNNFKRIAIDLVEDLYEHCRLYIYDKLGIEHEQDAGLRKRLGYGENRIFDHNQAIKKHWVSDYLYLKGNYSRNYA